MSNWPSAKARRVLAALLRIGWAVKRHDGTSHRTLARDGWPDYVFSFHEAEEILSDSSAVKTVSRYG